jgi:4-hydroxy-tetrahydrodipicolinate reductase
VDREEAELDTVKVAIWGFGAMGSGMARMLLAKRGAEVVAVCDAADDWVGRDMYEVLGADRQGRPEVVICNDPAEVFRERGADVLLLATDSFTRGAFDKVVFALEHRMNVISTAEELAYPQAQEPEFARRLDAIAVEHDATVLGTGINPGFVMDYLVLALTGTCERVDQIKAVRINDLSPFGATVMREQGVGTTVDEFSRGVEAKTISGHVGFPESIRMITDGIGWSLDKVEETREPIVSNVRRAAEHKTIEAGQVAGCRHRGFGTVGGEVKVEMDHPQQILPRLEGAETGDFIWIEGTPNIALQIKPEIPGGIGTIAMCVNMIPHVINAEAGLKTMLDLPVPRAMMGDMRDLVKAGKRVVR